MTNPAISSDQLACLRQTILESLRAQRGGARSIPYIDVDHSLTDIAAHQNHAVFGRRGCGKTLLLHRSADLLPARVRCVYINCEDLKTRSFPNVLIEILDTLFKELGSQRRAWFGRKKRIRQLIAQVRRELNELREQDDRRDEPPPETVEPQDGETSQPAIEAGEHSHGEAQPGLGRLALPHRKDAIERAYRRHDEELEPLNRMLPALKSKLSEFFKLSRAVKTVFLQLDDFHRLRRIDQPHVMDYIHRLCQDLPLYYKVATLPHAGVLYADRRGQPTGAQARLDYQPIDVDCTLGDVSKTEKQLREILRAFGELCGIPKEAVDGLFKGEGFKCLAVAAGGVPRDFLSLFLQALDNVSSGDGRIGKDDVRDPGLAAFERRIEELKLDSDRREHDVLLAAIHVIRSFCLDRQNSGFLVSEQLLRENDGVRELLYRLLDCRIVHQAATALPHRHREGTFRAFMIDAGCYAFLRTLRDQVTEVDLWQPTARERLRACPVLDLPELARRQALVPDNVEAALKSEAELTVSGDR